MSKFETANDLRLTIKAEEKEILVDEVCCTSINIILKNDGQIMTSFLGAHNPEIVKNLEKAMKMYFKGIKKALKLKYKGGNCCEEDCECGDNHCGHDDCTCEKSENNCKCGDDCKCGESDEDCKCGDDCDCKTKHAKKPAQESVKKENKTSAKTKASSKSKESQTTKKTTKTQPKK